MFCQGGVKFCSQPVCHVTSFPSVSRDELRKFGNSFLEEVQIANQVERKESNFSKLASLPVFDCSGSQPFQRKPHCCWSHSFSLSNARCSCLPPCWRTLLCPGAVAVSSAPPPFKATGSSFLTFWSTVCPKATEGWGGAKKKIKYWG